MHPDLMRAAGAGMQLQPGHVAGFAAQLPVRNGRLAGWIVLYTPAGFRVLPAHMLEVRIDGSVQQKRFWSAADIAPIKLSSNQAYAEGLRSCLDQAVESTARQRLGSEPANVPSPDQKLAQTCAEAFIEAWQSRSAHA